MSGEARRGFVRFLVAKCADCGGPPVRRTLGVIRLGVSGRPGWCPWVQPSWPFGRGGSASGAEWPILDP